MRIYYDQDHRMRGYSLPLWAVFLKWLIVATIIVTPIWLFFHWLGIG